MEFIQNELNEIKELLNKQTIQQKEFLTLNEAAEILGLSRSRLYKMTSNKEIPHYKPGGKKIYLNRKELDEWILNSRISDDSEVDETVNEYLQNSSKI